MRALIDGDILRYEIGYAAETGWRAITGRDEVPPFDYVEQTLTQRIANILNSDEAISSYCLYLTEGETFRYEIATVKPYKGTRKDKKPWHFHNLTAYMQGVLPTKTVTYIEADDAIGIDHCDQRYPTIVCSRDKDLRQLPGPIYSWEIGRQPSFGPTIVDALGEITITKDHKDIKGTGFKFFAAQMLIGDKVDNIPGLPTLGPVKALELLQNCETEEACLEAVEKAYKDFYGDEWEERMVEQGRLCWIVRELDESGNPLLWERGKIK